MGKNKTDARNSEKKKLKLEKREKRKEKRADFFRRHKKAIAVSLICVFAVAFSMILATGIVYMVFSSEPIIVGEKAQNILIYDKPASKITRKYVSVSSALGLDKQYDIFQQASLPLGNGDMGLSVLGETDVETLIFNEKTLWSGGPVTGRSDYNGDNFTGVAADGLTESERFYAIRDALLNGDEKTAEKLFNNLQGNIDNKGAYLAWGDVVLDFGHKRVKDYKRSLDVDNALSNVSYSHNGTVYSREIFANNPSNVIAIELSSQGDELNFTVGFTSKQDGSDVVVANNGILNYGALSNGLNYYFELRVDANGGRLSYGDNTISIDNTHKAHIYLSAATDYKMDFPVYRTGETASELAERVSSTVATAAAKGYDALKNEHLSDYHNLYNRVKLNFGGVKPSFSTDTLIRRYPTVFLRNSHRKYLEQLLYNYGRYLLISSSRENSQLPANLQGVWNQSNEAPWQSDYHINVNLQMNYWPAYNTNLYECAAPLVKYVDGLREPGRITSKTYTATAAELEADLPDEYYGFIAHTESNPYGHTTPGTGEFVKALWSPVAVAWLLQNVYEGYEYTKDASYLAYVYPIMKEALRYFERTMIMYGGRLVSAPSYSPEHGPLTAGNTYEQSLIWQLLTDSIAAATELGVDEDKVVQWTEMREKLNPIEIGSGGQIKEWYDETYNWSVGKPFHRHTSHLLGLFPGDLINKDANPEWAEAARVTLKWRGKNTTGWAMGQRINTYARLGDGNNAYKLIKKLFAKGIYANLFDAHPPFQIDGNFGYTAGVTEMLMQSNMGYIELLPALPSQWAQGEINGIVARGNFEIDMKWTNNTVDYATIKSVSGSECQIKLNDADNYKVIDENGNPIAFTVANGTIRFETTTGASYTVVKI